MLQHTAAGGLPGHGGAGRLRLFQPPPHSHHGQPHAAWPGPQTARDCPHGLQTPQYPPDGPEGTKAERSGARGQARNLGTHGGQLHGQRLRSRCGSPSGHHLLPCPLGEPSRAPAVCKPHGWQSQHVCDQQQPNSVVVTSTGHSGSQPLSCCDPECPRPSPGHTRLVSPPDKAQPEPSVCGPSECPSLDPVSLQDSAGPGEVPADTWSHAQPWASGQGPSSSGHALRSQPQGASAELPPQGPSEARGGRCSGAWQVCVGKRAGVPLPTHWGPQRPEGLDVRDPPCLASPPNSDSSSGKRGE